MLPLVHLWLKSYGRAGLVVLLAGALGYPMTRRVLRGPASSVLTLLLGFASLSLVVCLLSWVHLFSRWTIGIVAIVAVGASLKGLRSDVPRWWARRRWPASLGAVACFAILGLALVFFSVLAIYPSTAFDATSYHLPLARDLVEHHGLVYDPYVRFSFFPQGNESVFAVMLLITRNPVCSAALEFAVLAIGTLLIPLWFKGGRDSLGAGFIGAVVLLSSPMLVWVGTTAFIDAWTMVFVLAGLVCGLEASRNPAARGILLILMGIFLGEAAASKYSALAICAFVVVAVVIAIGAYRDLWRGMLGALGGFLLVAAPWYAWTFHTTGDPLYPFATSVFGNRPGLWNQGEIQLQIIVQRATSHPGIRSILDGDLQFLTGRSGYNTGANRSPLSWFLGLGFLGIFMRHLRRDRSYVGVLVASLLSVAFFISQSADPRFFVPALGILSVATAFVAERPMMLLGDLASSLSSNARQPLIALAGVAATIAILWSSIGYARTVFQPGGPPVTADATAAYLTARVQCYAQVAYLNQTYGSHYRAWGYACEQSRYYANGLLIGDAFSIGARDRIFDDGGSTLPSPATLNQRLTPLHVGWAILPVGTPPNPQDLERGGLFKLVEEADGNALYKVMSQGK